MGLTGSRPATPSGVLPPTQPSSFPWYSASSYTAPSYYSTPNTSRMSFGGIFKTAFIVIGIIVGGFLLYNFFVVGSGGTSTSLFSPPTTMNQIPTAVSGKKKTEIPAANVPITSSARHGVQFWMYIEDWGYNFNKRKVVMKRIDPANASNVNPFVFLHETDNSLGVQVSVYPTNSAGSGASTPAGANNTDATDDVFTCTVENVPLQTWFAVSITIFDKNMDIYINGKLVKSCALSGIPKPAMGSIIIGDDDKGFSGKMCGLQSYPMMLTPSDAMSFFSAGTACSDDVPEGGKTLVDTPTLRLFGYTLSTSVLDKTGKEIKKYTF